MVDGVEDVLLGDAVLARLLVNLHTLIVIRKEALESSLRERERDDRYAIVPAPLTRWRRTFRWWGEIAAHTARAMGLFSCMKVATSKACCSRLQRTSASRPMSDLAARIASSGSGGAPPSRAPAAHRPASPNVRRARTIRVATRCESQRELLAGSLGPTPHPVPER
jgi:hypothetical protein